MTRYYTKHPSIGVLGYMNDKGELILNYDVIEGLKKHKENK